MWGGGPRRTLPRTTTPMPTNWRERGKSFQRDRPMGERRKNVFANQTTPEKSFPCNCTQCACARVQLQYQGHAILRISGTKSQEEENHFFFHPELTNLKTYTVRVIDINLTISTPTANFVLVQLAIALDKPT